MRLSIRELIAAYLARLMRPRGAGAVAGRRIIWDLRVRSGKTTTKELLAEVLEAAGIRRTAVGTQWECLPPTSMTISVFRCLSSDTHLFLPRT